jgi:hypothetical protein
MTADDTISCINGTMSKARLVTLIGIIAGEINLKNLIELI